MVIMSDAVSPMEGAAFQAAVLLYAHCSPPARILVLDQGGHMMPLLQAVGYAVLGQGEDAVDVAACVVSGPLPPSDLGVALGAVAKNGVLVFGRGDITEDELARHGFALAPISASGALAVAVKGQITAMPAAVRPPRPEPALLQDDLRSALGELESRMVERLDRLSLQSTQLVNSLDRLSYAVSLKGRLVSLLRHTGTLNAAASVLSQVRAARGSFRRRRPAVMGPVMQMASGAAVFGPVAIASAGQVANDIEAVSNQKKIGSIRLKPPVAPADESSTALSRPEADSLAGWLALHAPDEASNIKTFMVDLDDRGVALNLLRGRLLPEQALLLVRRSGQDPLPAELGQPDAVEGQLAYYRAAPSVLRAPSDEVTKDAELNGFSWPKISMIMVSFNQADFLEEGIRSILDQGYPNLEFILIDGGSTDGSAEIIERYRDRLDKVVIERDRGQSDGLNKGFDRATGEVLSWLNSDDLLLPGALAKVGRAFRHYGSDMVVGGCKQVQQNGRDVVVAHHNHLPFGQKIALPLEELLDFDNRWQGGAFFYQPEVFFSRDLWLRSGGGLRLDLYYVLDYDLWIRMAAAGATVAHIPDFLAASRIHEQQKTKFGENPFIPEARRLLAEYSTGVHWTRPSVA